MTTQRSRQGKNRRPYSVVDDAFLGERMPTRAELDATLAEAKADYEAAREAGFPCGVCGATWTGANRSHCTGCHRTFSSVSAFDLHRRDLKCHDPATIVNKKTGEAKLVFKDGLWKGAGEWEGQTAPDDSQAVQEVLL